MTFRLYDWDHVDAKTGQPRPLQVEQAMACIDFAQSAVGPVVPVVEEAKPVLRERLFDCEHFGLWRLRGESPFRVGAAGRPRVLVCIAGEGQLEHDGADYAFGKGDVLLLPAVVGACLCRPRGAVSLLDISLPEGGLTHEKAHCFSIWMARLPKAKHLSMPRWPHCYSALLGIVKVAVISGGDWPHFQKQVLSNLPMTNPEESFSSSHLRDEILPIRRGLEKTLFGRFHRR